MKKFIYHIFFLLICFNITFSYAIEYSFGRGLQIKNFNIGGYTAFVYQHTEKNEMFAFDELAFLGFIDITDKFKFFAEIEYKDIYVKYKKQTSIYKNKTFEFNPIVNRAYIDYIHNDYFKIRVGRFITPLGFWNPIYVIVLRWTTSNPITATDFYPRFTTGIGISGYLPFQDDSWEYDLFIQTNDFTIEEKVNSIVSKDFMAFQIKKYFSDYLTFAASLGKYRKKYFREKVKFLGLNLKFKYKKAEVIYELFLADEINDNYYPKEYIKTSYYLQGVYRIISKNYLIGRYEYFKDLSDGKHIENYLLGWNFRPMYPISIKVEYIKSHNKLGANNKYFDRYLASFSVLF